MQSALCPHTEGLNTAKYMCMIVRAILGRAMEPAMCKQIIAESTRPVNLCPALPGLPSPVVDGWAQVLHTGPEEIKTQMLAPVNAPLCIDEHAKPCEGGQEESYRPM
eukprot:3898938-Alexandrium_andersonii.AAC.1